MKDHLKAIKILISNIYLTNFNNHGMVLKSNLKFQFYSLANCVNYTRSTTLTFLKQCFSLPKEESGVHLPDSHFDRYPLWTV